MSIYVNIKSVREKLLVRATISCFQSAFMCAATMASSFTCNNLQCSSSLTSGQGWVTQCGHIFCAGCAGGRILSCPVLSFSCHQLFLSPLPLPSGGAGQALSSCPACSVRGPRVQRVALAPAGIPASGSRSCSWSCR